MTALSLGLPGITSHETIARLAPLLEDSGFHALWLNDTAQGDALAGLGVAARVTSTLHLGAGVIALDRRSAADIAARLGDLPVDRLTVGLGAGAPAKALARVRAGVLELRQSTTAEIVVGGLGPRMRALAAEVADGVLLNWVTPAAAADASRELHSSAARARAILYVRTAVDVAAEPALRAEAAKYDAIPSYAANLERIGATAIQTTIGPDTLASGIAEYTAAVDELVLRAITADDSLATLEHFVRRVLDR